MTYLVLTNEHDKKSCTFVMAKSRVAPLNQGTVKMTRMLRQKLDMQLEELLFYLDSMTALGYTENYAARYKTFIANRVSLISSASKPSEWRSVNSEKNPVGHVSRGLTAEHLMRCENCAEGPSFLPRPCSEWPVRTDQHCF